MFWKDHILSYMKENKHSQASFARKIGVSESAVSLWLSGDRKSPINIDLKKFIEIMYETDRERKNAIVAVFFGVE